MMKKAAKEVVNDDLDYICRHLFAEFERMAGQHVLITGGAGFLGYYMVQSIVHWNRCSLPGSQVDLTVIDNFRRGMPAWLRELHGEPHLKVIQKDITMPLNNDIGEFEYLVHAASIASPIYYRAHPIETMDANVSGLRSLLEYARKGLESGKTIDGVLFFSSSEIYGDPTPENIPTPETYRGFVSCTGPRACYDEAKRFGETLCVNFAHHAGVPVTVVRPFNNYGPGLKITDRRVLPDFARNIVSGRDMLMFSDGSPKRTFCYVADAVIGYYKALVRGRRGEAYNIGVEAPEISIADLAEQLIHLARKLFDYRGQLVKQVSPDAQYLQDNPNRRCPVIAKARAELGYDPSISLDEGLIRSLIWYSEHSTAPEG